MRLFFVLLSSIASLATASTAMPDAEVYRSDGTPLRLSSYSGQVLIVDFWASWCVPCKASFPALDAIYREYHARGLDVVAVNLDDDRRRADAFLAARPHEMTVLFDPKGAAPLAFGVKGMPSSFVIDRRGEIRFTHMGYSGAVDANYRREIVQLLQEHPTP